MTLEGSGHAGVMLAYAAAMGTLHGVGKIILRDMPESFMQSPGPLRSSVLLFGIMKLFDLPQLYKTVRYFNPQAEIRFSTSNGSESL